MTVMASALRTVGLAAPGAHRKPSGRYRATGPATTKLGIPVPKLRDLIEGGLLATRRGLLVLARSRRARVALGAVLLAVWLVACGSPAHGTVTRKSFTPAHTDYQLHCAAYNAKMTCIAWINQPYSYPDQWELYITDPKDGEGWVDVTKDEYDRATPGMHWSEKGGLTQ